VLLLVGVHALVQFRGGVGSDLYPLTYVAVALVASFATGPAGIGVVAFAVVLGFAIAFLGEQVVDPLHLGLNALFVIGFGVLTYVFTRAEIVRVRRKSELELEARKEKVRDDTRLFRLIAPSSDGVRDEDRLYQTSVQEVRQALYHALQLLHRTLDLHTCVLLMPGDETEQLRIIELVTKSDNVADGPFSLGAGAVGAAVRRKLTTNLQQVRPEYRGICYYRGPAPVRSFIAVPVLERNHLRAVLCADRVIDRAFSPEEEELLRDSTSHVLRAFENERVFMQLERSKREQEILYRVSQALSTALTQDAVMSGWARRRKSRPTTLPRSPSINRRAGGTSSGAPLASVRWTFRGSGSATTHRSPPWSSRTATTSLIAESSIRSSRCSSPRRPSSRGWSRSWCCL
jgi:hypothetical protein